MAFVPIMKLKYVIPKVKLIPCFISATTRVVLCFIIPESLLP